MIDFPVGRNQEPEEAQTCFRCQHYDEPKTTCLLFDEQIDSELYAARDCPGYETGEETE